jgi:hypothetical protein
VALRETLDRLMEGVLKSPHIYESSLDSFPKLDIEKLLIRLDPKKRGATRGEQELPPEEPDALDEVEAEIVDFVENERVNAQSAAINQIQVYDERMAALDFDGRFTVVRSASAEAVAEFKVESLQGKDRLHSLRRKLTDLERERERFKQRHRLERTAHYPTSAAKFLKFGFLALLFVVETVINGAFLAKGNELGLLGGTIEALTFAALNIFGTALIGFFGIRWLFHRSLAAKFFGLMALLAFLAFSATLNLSLAHYREVSGVFFEVAGTEIIRRIAESPLALTDIKSWLFLGIGILFSIFSVMDVISLDDRYPGYGSLDRRLENARALYIEWKEHLLDRLRDIREDATTALSDASRDLGIRRSESEIIIDRRGTLVSQFRSHLSHLERVGARLLREYRSANQKARSTKFPSHFNTHHYEIDLSPVDALSKSANRLENLSQAIDEAQATLKEQIASIHSAYEAAAGEYAQLDTLIQEDDTSRESLT